MLQPLFQSRSHRGSAMIGILIVMAIICVILVMGPLSKTKTESGDEIAQAIEPIERAADVGCTTNRISAATELTGLQILDSGQAPQGERLQEILQRYRCPRKGVIILGADGKFYCTQHEPPPVEELTAMVTRLVAQAPQ